MRINPLLAIRQELHFSKQMLLFHPFLSFTLRYVKQLLNVQNIIVIIFQFLSNLFLNVIIYWYIYSLKSSSMTEKKHDLNVTLPSQMSLRNQHNYYLFGLKMAIIINYSFFQNLSLMYICAIYDGFVTDFWP